MGLVDKSTLTGRQDKVALTGAEVDFILDKLRTATFIGEEFQQFYNVWVKLTELKKSKK